MGEGERESLLHYSAALSALATHNCYCCCCTATNTATSTLHSMQGFTYTELTEMEAVNSVDSILFCDAFGTLGCQETTHEIVGRVDNGGKTKKKY